MIGTTGHELDPGGVNHPAHYNMHASRVECIELIRDLNFDIGSAVKYVMRRGDKGDPLKDLNKARWYLEDFIYTDHPTEEEPHPATRISYGDSLKFGRIARRWQWDQVIAAEPDPQARAFYLAVARQDAIAALQAVQALIASEVAHQ